MPAVVTVEIAQEGPHAIGRRVYDGRADDADHRLASKLPLQRVETALKDTAADIADQLGLAFRRAIEFCRPFDERSFAVGDRRQPQRGDIVLDAHRGFENRIGAEQIEIREAEQLLANALAVTQTEIADAADLVGRLAVLDAAFRDARMPGGQAVEVAHARPDAVGAAIDDT